MTKLRLGSWETREPGGGRREEGGGRREKEV